MAAQILSRDIQTGIEQAWHGKTNIVKEITKDNCGIVYAMEKQSLFLPNGGKTDHFAVVSLDDGMAIGNPVKKNYKVIPNGMMIDMVESALAGTSHKIVSVGSLCEREKVFCSIKIADDFVAAGRETKNVLNVLWGHGGVFGVTARAGFTVVVCANTFNMALRAKKKGEFAMRLKHTGDTELKIENMEKAIESHYGVVAEFKAAMDSIQKQSVSEDGAKEIFAGLLVRDLEGVEEISSRTSNTIDNLSRLFKGGAGNDGNDLSDVFNAVTDYYSHDSSGGENRWKQFESSEFGAGNRIKGEAFDLLTGKTVKGLGDMAEVIKRGNRVLQMI